MAHCRLFVLLLGVAVLAQATFATDDDLKIDVQYLPEPCEDKATNGLWVGVHYVGKLEDGTEFDNSYNRGNEIEFKLGDGQVIAGWDQGIEGMCLHEKRRLTIPPHLGYGEEGIGPIPGGATLIFDVELVRISEYPEQPPEEGDEEGYEVYQSFGGEDIAQGESYGEGDGYMDVGGTINVGDLEDQ